MRESELRISKRWVVASALSIAAFVSLASARPVPPAAVKNLAGPVQVLDGDTIDIGGVRVRLEGIDAAESAQTCGKGWFSRWPCGAAATRALDRLARSGTVTCEPRGRDAYDRILGICLVDGRDINAEMVRTGHAWAFVKYSSTYVGEEAEARTLKLGIWKEPNEPAWAFREKQWAGAEQQAPKGCAIKGNVSRHGQIYHMPWNAFYARVSIDAARGERWFCSESEAIAAGWRPAGTAQ